MLISYTNAEDRGITPKKETLLGAQDTTIINEISHPIKASQSNIKSHRAL